MRPKRRKWLVYAAAVVAAILAVPLSYLAAATVGFLVTANDQWREAEGGITIYVQTNGVHTWIVVPKVTAEMDWRGLAQPGHIGDPRYALGGTHIAIGFGNREFYLNTPTWGDLSPRTALAAAVGGGPSLMHVYHDWDVRPDGDRRPIILNREQYRLLTRYLLASFDYREGRWIPLRGRGYGPSDIFYESRRPYHFERTCNEWTGEALRAAGIRAGIWTPLAQSIMWRLD